MSVQTEARGPWNPRGVLGIGLNMCTNELSLLFAPDPKEKMCEDVRAL